MNKRLLVLVSAGLLAGSAAWAEVGVNINLNIGSPAPAPIIVREAPLFLVPAAIGISVAVGVPYDMVFIEGRYYLLHGNVWHVSSRYDGPWAVIVHDRLPPGLRKVKFEKVRHYRDEEYRAYQRDRDRYQGKAFRPEGDDDGHGKGKKGKGKKEKD